MLAKLLIALLVLAGLGLAVRLYMSQPDQDRLRSGEAVVIRDLRDPIPGNAFLACPPDYCAATAAPSPVFALPVDILAQRWADLLANEPHVVIATSNPAQHRLVVIQHTPLLRFPDVITAEFVPLGADKSSLAVYSRSRYGRGDFGTNRKRVLAWLDRLQQITKPP